MPEGPEFVGNGRYRLGKTLGEGTFGQVRLGHEAKTGETVAVKIIERDRIHDDAARERLRNEVRILHAIEHPHLVRLLEVIEEPDATYLVTEHVGGGELFGYIVQRGHLPEEEAASLFAQIVAAVASFHELSLIHRDLKPENMLLSPPGEGTEAAGGGRAVKIIDFGLGAVLDAPDVVLEAACGSPHYAAPEMLIGGGYKGPQADMWSLGVCLYAMVCGCLPFDEDDMEVLYDRIIAGDYSFDGCPPLSSGAESLIKRLLTTNPEQRLTARQVLDHRWLQSLAPPEAPRPTLPGGLTDLARGAVLKLLADEYGVPRAEVISALAGGERSYVTAVFFLIRQREVRRGRVLDQPRHLPRPPQTKRPTGDARRPVPRRLREAPTAAAAAESMAAAAAARAARAASASSASAPPLPPAAAAAPSRSSSAAAVSSDPGSSDGVHTPVEAPVVARVAASATEPDSSAAELAQRAAGSGAGGSRAQRRRAQQQPQPQPELPAHAGAAGPGTTTSPLAALFPAAVAAEKWPPAPEQPTSSTRSEPRGDEGLRELPPPRASQERARASWQRAATAIHAGRTQSKPTAQATAQARPGGASDGVGSGGTGSDDRVPGAKTGGAGTSLASSVIRRLWQR